MTTTSERGPRGSRPFIAGAFLAGIGFGAFFDGIVLHQVLQWHHMLTATGDHPATTVAGLEMNTLADGLFHVVALVCTVTGVFMLTTGDTHWPGHGRSMALLGLILFGWGVFNVVEGVVDHHLLAVHHVRDDVAEPLPWDLGFLAVSLVIGLTGFLVTRIAFERGLIASDPSKRAASYDPGRPPGGTRR